MSRPIRLWFSAILLAGGVVVNVNPLYTPHELEHQINDAGARFIFVLENFAHTVAHAWPNMRVEQAIVTAPGDLLGFKGMLINVVSRWVKRAVRPYALPASTRFADVFREGRKRPFQPVDVSRDDIAFLQYTGRNDRRRQGRRAAASQCRRQCRASDRLGPAARRAASTSWSRRCRSIIFSASPPAACW